MVISLIIWLAIGLLPWQPWRTREQLDTAPEKDLTNEIDLSEVTVLIPARNEADTIKTTLTSLQSQADDLQIIVIDDESEDNTASVVASLEMMNLKLIQGKPGEHGWSGKIWALEQGRNQVTTPYILLLDADIALSPGVIKTLLWKLKQEDRGMISLMAELRMQSLFEKLLMPAFIFFFKLLYPFQLSNQGKYGIAAAAGGCILIKSHVLDEIGGFAAIRGALIDDCSLAAAVQKSGYSTWIGLTHSATSLRPYENLASIWKMVARTAFTQLHHSVLLLCLCIVLMTLAFIVPVLTLISGSLAFQCISFFTLLLQFALFLPVLNYYRIHPVWTLSLPIAGFLYLLMTCDSAKKHIMGDGAEWKGRKYGKNKPAI